MLQFLCSLLDHLREFSLYTTGRARLQWGPALPLRLGCRLAALLLLYNLNDVVGFCTAATDDLLREQIDYPHHFSHPSPPTAELQQRLDQQLWLQLNGSLPGHWVPSRWGLQLGASCAALLLSFWALMAAARPVEAIFGFLLLLLSLLLPLLQLEADYVGAIHLMVYPGAILIFFSFATLTTDQRCNWGEPSGPEGREGSLWAGLRRRLVSRLSTLLVALPLLLLWWRQLAGRVGFSLQSRANQPTSLELAAEDLLPTELLRSSDLVALGLEIFQRRLLSLTLLGLLLLLAFLTALELLAPQRRRRSSSLFPRLGALFGLLFLTEDSWPDFGWPLNWPQPRSHSREGLELLLSKWNYYGGDVWLLPLLPLLALGLGALATRRYAFLHSFLLLEALGLLLNVFLVVTGVAADDLGGSVLVLFTVAVAAAETAVGLALFLLLSQGSAPAAAVAAAGRRRRRWSPASACRSHIFLARRRRSRR